MKRPQIKDSLPGLALCVLLSGLAIAAAQTEWVRDHLHWSPLLLVILFGMAWRAVMPVTETQWKGIAWVQKPILRIGVAGLGFRLSFDELWRIGGTSLGVMIVATGLAVVLGLFLSKRLTERKQGLLLAAGNSICGASAIVAADSVVQAERRDVAVSLAVITLWGTVGILVYPVIGRSLGLSQAAYGLWAGASLQEMAQVVAAGFDFGDEAIRVATVVKLGRICLLAPLVFGFSLLLRKRNAGLAAGAKEGAKVPLVPWFLVAFVVFAAVRTIGFLPVEILGRIQTLDLWLLCIGMAAIGLQTGFKDLKAGGVRPLLSGLIQWLALAGVTLGAAMLL
jgi:uncharacterized integral membrane protein (TIGR00698 family)